MFSIRKAVESDIQAILIELEAFSAFYKTKMPPYRDHAHSTKIVTDMINNHVFFVGVKHEDDHEEVVGFIAGFIYPHIYNPDISVLTEAFWWVRPEHRKSGVGVSLLEAYIQHGEKHNNWILMTIEDETPIPESLLLDRGFRLKEKTYIMEVS